MSCLVHSTDFHVRFCRVVVKLNIFTGPVLNVAWKTTSVTAPESELIERVLVRKVEIVHVAAFFPFPLPFFPLVLIQVENGVV